MRVWNEYLTIQTKNKREFINITPQVKAALEKSGIRVIGAVLNQVDLDKERHSGIYKFYHHTYRRYYKPTG